MLNLKILLLAAVAWNQGALANSAVKVMTDKPAAYLDGVKAEFTRQTGIPVEVESASYADLKEGLKSGAKSADVLLTKDVFSIVDAATAGLYGSMRGMPELETVEDHMRDPQGRWTALAYRIRGLAYDPAMIPDGALKTYADLADKNEATPLCLRNLKDYMPALVAWMISHYGEAEASRIVAGWRAKAWDFTTGDTNSLKAIDAGQCVATITNHYYLARLKAADPRLSLRLVFANQDDGGVHTNGFGGGILASSAQPEAAKKFMAFLLSPAGQALLVKAPSFEYPAVKGVRAEGVTMDFGTFKASRIHWSEVAGFEAKARAILDQVGWAK